MSRVASTLCLTLVLILNWGGLSETCGAEALPTRKVVLIAGPKSHGPEGNRIHDYPWSVRLLKVMLENSNIKDRLRVEFHLNGWPKDQTTLENADTIMVISDGRDGDLYAEAPFLENEARVAFVARQMARGCGFMTFHFSTFAPDRYAPEVLEWTGGYFDWETDGKRQWYSAITTLDTEIKVASPQHPVTRGVVPFRMKEEFYYNIRFRPEDNALTPLLSVPALNGRPELGDVVAWARQRKDGGRGFGTTCGHFFDNWRNDHFRTLILNAVAWTAGVEVPEKGVTARFYEHEEILALLEAGGRRSDRPKPGEAFASVEDSAARAALPETLELAAADSATLTPAQLQAWENREGWYRSHGDVIELMRKGRNLMPASPPMTAQQEKDLLDFLFGRDRSVRSMGNSAPGRPRYSHNGYPKLLDGEGYPGCKPPWGTLNALDLNTGRLAWKVPLGEYAELTDRGIAKTGTENFGGPIATGGGLIFCAGTRDLKLRAFDAKTGEELWQHALPYGGFAPPATYVAEGRQFVVVPATGGGKLGGQMGDAYVAFALPSPPAQ